MAARQGASLDADAELRERPSPQALLGDGRPAQVPGEALELGAVARRDRDLGVDAQAL